MKENKNEFKMVLPLFPHFFLQLSISPFSSFLSLTPPHISPILFLFFFIKKIELDHERFLKLSKLKKEKEQKQKQESDLDQFLLETEDHSQSIIKLMKQGYFMCFLCFFQIKPNSNLYPSHP